MITEANCFPQRATPLQKTVCYRISSTVYKAQTSRGGTEPLCDKMARLIRSDTITASSDKISQERYHAGGNLCPKRTRSMARATVLPSKTRFAEDKLAINLFQDLCREVPCRERRAPIRRSKI